MADKERPLNGTVVGICVDVKKTAVVLSVVDFSDAVIHGYCDDLRSLKGCKIPGDVNASAAAVGENTESWVALLGRLAYYKDEEASQREHCGLERHHRISACRLFAGLRRESARALFTSSDDVMGSLIVHCIANTLCARGYLSECSMCPSLVQTRTHP